MDKQKKFLALALLLLTLATVGCGKGPDIAPGETIGAGASNEIGLNVPGSDPEAKKLKDFVVIPLWLTSIQEDKTELDLLIGHHLEEVKSVEISYQEVLLDGAAAENWETREQEGAAVFVTEPEMGYSQTLILSVNIEKYSELTIRATATYDDGTEPYPFSGTFQISELERRLK